MAVMANGALLKQDGYEFGVDRGGEIVKTRSYADAKRLSGKNGYPMKMRAVYRTNWIEAK
jgi:hypothetical protein